MVRISAALLASVLLTAGSLRAQEAAPNPPSSDEPAATAPQKSPVKPRPPKPAPKPATATAQVAPAPAQAATPVATNAAQFANGASSISENYGDWTVSCGLENGARLCVLSQAQGNKETGQRSFAIELRSPRDGKTEGTILMPFRLKLETGALLKLDDKDLGQGLRFSTCVPQGCLLPVSFPSVATNAMQGAKRLDVIALDLGNDQVVTFSISLYGFAAALDRTIQLGG